MDERQLENVSSIFMQAEVALHSSTVADDGKVVWFQVREIFFAHAPSFTTKWPAMKSKYYGPCNIVAARHPQYVLEYDLGRRTR